MPPTWGKLGWHRKGVECPLALGQYHQGREHSEEQLLVHKGSATTQELWREGYGGHICVLTWCDKEGPQVVRGTLDICTQL